MVAGYPYCHGGHINIERARSPPAYDALPCDQQVYVIKKDHARYLGAEKGTVGPILLEDGWMRFAVE